MKKLAPKIPAMIGMGISAVSFVLVLYAWFLLNHELYDGRGMSRSFAMWIFSAIFAMLSIVFYLIDANDKSDYYFYDTDTSLFTETELIYITESVYILLLNNTFNLFF